MSKDLANYAQPIGGFIDVPATAADRTSLQLTDKQLACYEEKGYVAGVKILSDEQISQLRSELEAFFNPEHDGRELWYEYHSNESNDANTVLFHALGAWRISPGFHDLLWHPAFTIPASQLVGGDVRFWHDQLFCKPAKHGGVVAWHQDYSYWTRTKPMTHLTCWIGLDDSTADNGCLHYVPGSHRWDLLPITGLAGDMEAIQEVLTPEQWKQFQNPDKIELKAGECSFHHPLLVHGSFANRTERPRRATVINVFRDGVHSATDEPLLGEEVRIPDGEPMAGKFFPLLSTAEKQ
ncbi:MAG: phytanoyl-CoA dioxygenase family protein [bacterium]|nr:phytanoyl-CoA dioxygenase family protein [bacterium]